jgi:hypothetical protein
VIRGRPPVESRHCGHNSCYSGAVIRFFSDVFSRTSTWAVASVVLALVSGCSSSASSLAPNDGGDLDTLGVVQTDGASPDMGEDAGDAGLSCDPSLTYATFGMTFFATYCGSCHRWDQVSAQESGGLLIAVAGPGGFMPPVDPRPTDAERARLAAWLTCGAP